MADKLMYIPNDDTKIPPSVDYNQWLKSLDTQLNEPTNAKFNKSTQGYSANELENVTIRLLELL